MSKKIYVDLDGVLSDFMGAIKEFYAIHDFTFPNGEWNWVPELCKQRNMSQNDFWENLTHQFWAQMPWTSDGREIINHLASKVGFKNICVLSSPANAISAYGKMTWIKREVPELHKLGNFCLNRNKGFIAHHNTILVDDGDHNITLFEKAGGKGLLYPRQWNSDWHLAETEIAFDTFTERFDALLEDTIVE